MKKNSCILIHIFRPWNYELDCGRVRGGDSTRSTHPWFVLLRFQARAAGGAANVKLHYTATLVSSRYLVAAAEIFDEPAGHDSRD